MERPNVALEGAAVVVKGSFNPAILSPNWLHQLQLISSVELDHQDVDIISRDITAFSAGWAAVRATPDHLQLSTSDVAEFERVRDLAIGILRSLPHTPISGLGINRDFHFRVESQARWHAIGDALAPKDIWKSVLHQSGMQDVTLIGQRDDNQRGRIQVSVQPSARSPQAVFVGVNNHFDLVAQNPSDLPTRDAAWSLEPESAAETSEKIPRAISVLTDMWTASMQKAEDLLLVVAGAGL